MKFISTFDDDTRRDNKVCETVESFENNTRET